MLCSYVVSSRLGLPGLYIAIAARSVVSSGYGGKIIEKKFSMGKINARHFFFQTKKYSIECGDLTVAPCVKIS